MKDFHIGGSCRSRKVINYISKYESDAWKANVIIEEQT